MSRLGGWLATLLAVAVGVSAPAAAQQQSPPSGLVTPNGIPVTALEDARGGRFWVMTPCGNRAMVVGGTPLRHVEVILDPGHGGPVDTGAVGPNGLAEKEVNLAVAQAAATMLQARGVSTVLTRTADYATPLRVRADFADAVGATLLISIHHNAPMQPPSPTPGIEIFHEHLSPDSKRLGGLLYQRAMTVLSTFDVDWVAAPDAGVMAVLNSRGRDAYGMIRLPETTSVLVELGYMPNPAEAELFARPIYPRVAGRAIAEAVIDYLVSDEAGGGFREPRVFNPQPGVGRALCMEIPLGERSPASGPR